jgi:hypothetical protein
MAGRDCRDVQLDRFAAFLLVFNARAVSQQREVPLWLERFGDESLEVWGRVGRSV